MSGNDDIVFLALCEDDKWSLAERYKVAQTQKAVSDAKLSLRATGVSAVRVIYQYVDPQTRAFGRVLVFDEERIGAKPPSPPPYAKPFGEARPLPAIALEPPPPPAPKETPKEEPRRQASPAKPPSARAEPVAASPRAAAAPQPRASASAAGNSPPPAANEPGAKRGAALASAATPRVSAEAPRPLPAGLRVGPAPAMKATAAPSAAAEAAYAHATLGAVRPNAAPMSAARPAAGLFDGAEAPPSPDTEPKSEISPGLLEPGAKKLLAFLGHCIADAAAKGHFPSGQLDQKTRFGLHLLVLGAGQTSLAAIQAQAGAAAAGGSALLDITAEALAMLGSDRAAAQRVVGGLEDYARETRSAAMIRAGAEAMTAFLAGDARADTILSEIFKLWNMVDREGVLGIDEEQGVAIMFTDMVSSVETTQMIGDDGMMKLVDQHNLIVGAVLKTHRGHQVKHTGDGVMAMFPRVADGVAAAAEIQRQIAEFNAATSGMPLKVRIGLSAGNPIRKDDDYFGTVVQTAARVCPVAGAGEVALSDAMTRLPGCDGFSYSETILVPLKGFPEPFPVRKLLWGAPAGDQPAGRSASPPRESASAAEAQSAAVPMPSQ